MGIKFLGASSQYGTIADNADLNMGSGNFTICYWVYGTSYAPGGVGVGISSRHLSGFVGWLILTHQNDRLPIVWIEVNPSGGGSWDGEIKSTTALSDGSWHHIALTRVGDTFTLYQDGVNEGTDVVAGTINYGSGGYQFGSESYGAAYWNNTMADIRVYKGTGYTQPYIQTIYESRGNDNIVDNLVCRLLADDLTDGSTVVSMLDITGRGNNGGQVNNPTFEAFPLTLI